MINVLLFADELNEREAILEHVEKLRIEDRQVFRHEREQDAPALGLTTRRGRRSEIVTAPMTRALELQSGQTPARAPRPEQRRARRIADSIGFAFAS